MTSWKKIKLLPCLFLCVAMVLPLASQAQENTAPIDRVTQLRKQLQTYEKELNLTDKQKEELRPILRKSVSDKLDILKTYGFDIGGEHPELTLRQKIDLAEQIHTVDQNTRQQVSKILTPDQMTKFQQIQDQYRERRREEMMNRGS